MKSQRKEQGSTLHIVVIVIGVVVLLGLLGFVFWQNFMNKPTQDSDATTSTSMPKESEESSPAKTLTVSEWGVVGSYTSEFTIGYTLNGSDTLAMRDPSQRVGCEALGSVSKGMANDAAAIARAQVGDYYYLYTGPQAGCDDSENQTKAIEAVKEFVTSLKAQ